VNGALVALCLGNFAVGTATMVVPGMLPALADGLRVGIPDAGRLIAAFALTIAVFGPGLASAVSHVDRRRLLAVTLLLLFASLAASAFATDYRMLVATRVVSAACAGLFTSQAAGAAALLVEPMRRGSAVAFAFLGWSIAAVFGMPVSAWIADAFGWRTAFGAVAAVALVSALSVRFALPTGLRVQRVDAATWLRILADRPLLAIVAVTAIHSWAQFTVFSYITPIMKSQLLASPGAVSVLLALFGVTGIAGNVLAIREMDRLGPARVVMTSLALMLGAHVVMFAAGWSMVPMVVALAMWGAGCFAINSSQQTRLYAAAPALAPVSIALNSSAIYLGQAAGAESGARIIAASGFDPLTWLSIPVFVVAMATSAWAGKR
jgi:DHA1 family inner membrane transport protein